ncbi:MAG: heparinase II/III domain-containing protein [Alphaproteobacteria bacterium]
MNPARLWRTIRHLSAAQWGHRLTGRARRVAMSAFPMLAERRLHHAASRLPLPDEARPALRAAAAPVLALQSAVHGADPDGVGAGRFTLQNLNFDFGAPADIDWRGDFHEGANPLRRMNLAYMGYTVPLLARGRADDAEIALAVLRSFEAANGFAAQGVFGDGWNAYCASHRLINLLAGLALYHGKGDAPPADAAAEILDHVRFAAAYVRRNLERDLQYNHLMKNLTALSFYCAGLESVPPEFAFLRDAVPRALRQCVLGDGGHVERSPMYHLLALLDVDLLRATGLYADHWQPSLDELRDRMARALGIMSHPDGDIALFNDSWIGEAPRSQKLIGDIAPPAPARLAECGYVRLGAGDDAVLFDCGPCGPDDNPGHAHGDFLAVEISVAGRRLIVDPGVATYTAGALRHETRAAASHNGPHVSGIEPVEFWKSFRVGRRGRAAEITGDGLDGVAPLWAAGEHGGYAPVGIEVRRYVGLWQGRAALICDLWRGPRHGEEASRFLVPEIWTPQSGDGVAFDAGGTRVRLEARIGDLGAPLPARHWVRFGIEQPAHAITVAPVQSGGIRRAALWIAWTDDAAPPDDEKLDRLFEALADATAL